MMITRQFALACHSELCGVTVMPILFIEANLGTMLRCDETAKPTYVHACIVLRSVQLHQVEKMLNCKHFMQLLRTG
jgi:hypothetical protein